MEEQFAKEMTAGDLAKRMQRARDVASRGK
jgi:hypothetical protein